MAYSYRRKAQSDSTPMSVGKTAPFLVSLSGRAAQVSRVVRSTAGKKEGLVIIADERRRYGDAAAVHPAWTSFAATLLITGCHVCFSSLFISMMSIAPQVQGVVASYAEFPCKPHSVNDIR